jgi:hypothetical protein
MSRRCRINKEEGRSGKGAKDNARQRRPELNLY